MKNSRLLIIILLTLFIVTRLSFLNTGLNIIEPDEQDYQAIATSAANGWPLYWQGQPYFEKFPLFIYLGYFLGKAFPILFTWGPYVNLRLIAVLSSFGLTWLFFNYLRKRLDFTSAFLSTVFLLLTPLLLFYSRQGTYEAFFLFFGFLFFYFFDQYKNQLNPKKVFILAGLLTLAVLAKHINILLFILPGFHTLKLFLKTGLKSRLAWQYLLIPCFSLLAITLILLPVYLYSPALIIDQFIGVSQQFFITHPKTFFSILINFLKLSPYWLSWPVIVLSLAGLVYSLKLLHQSLNHLLVLAIGLLYINSYYITPRSFIFIVPYLLISLGYAISYLKNIQLGRIILVFMLLISIFQAKIAFSATRHHGVEASLDKIKTLYQQTSLPIYSTFEADKLTDITQLPISLLSPQATNSGIILTDKRKTELMLALSEPDWQAAKFTLDWIETHSQPVWQYRDPLSHFPGANLSNTFSIYVFN